MPSNILTTDTSFPQLTEEQSNDEKFGVITNYLYMLLEQLRYSMANLGRENFNDAEFDSIANIITEPVYVQLEGVEGEVASLQLTAQSLTSRITNAEGAVSSLTQTVNSITLSVSNGETSSTIRLLRDGIIVASRTIQFSGMVTFSDLSGSGTTIINGDNIQTGTISAINISGCIIEGSIFRSVLDYNGDYGGEIQFYYLSNYYLAGGIRLDDQGAGTQYENRYRMFVYTESVAGVAFAMKLQAAGGISIEADENVYIEAGTRLTMRSYSTMTIEGYGRIDISGDLYINGKAYVPYTPQASG